MNERIKQLAGQAGAIHIHGKPKDRALVGYDNIEKFAELIVAECIQVAMRSVSDDEPKEAWYLIQEHFGVKE